MPQPLAPKPLDPTEQAGQLSQVGKPRKPTPSARVSAACEACKKRRSRCTGRPPCQRCQNLGTECVFDLSLDMRRRAALQRTINESRLHQETLNGLIEGIRSGPSDHLDSLFQFIRSDASRDEVMNAIRRFWKDIENQGLDHMMLVQEGLVEWPTNKPQQSRAGLPGNLTGPQGHDAHHPSSIWLASSELQNRRQVLDTSTISSLLSTLKPTSLSGGEELLGRSVEFETLERYASPPWSATSSSSRSEGSTSVAEQTGGVERSDWHPALQMRSPTNRAPEQPQVSSIADS